MKFVRITLFTLIALLALASAVALHYYLPRKVIATVTGVEVKLTDKDGPIGRNNPADGPTVDVYYIYTSLPDADVRVFQNIDTGWGFPYYFKFDSADLQAKAKALEGKNVVISYYGWRFDMLSMFPNLTDVTLAPAEPSTFSFWRTLWFCAWAILAAVSFWLSWRITRRQPVATPA
ncbi:DUF1523 family protein [Chitinibacteraceae bacterium HSL-7]